MDMLNIAGQHLMSVTFGSMKRNVSKDKHRAGITEY
jgi:hypothetical protein